MLDVYRKEGTCMIDIHSHILPMIDDGANSIDMALQMLDQAYRSGTDAIVLTPHLAYAYGFENPYDKIINLFRDFQKIVADVGIPIQMYLGTEFLFSSPHTFDLHKDEITTMNQTQYLLMEFYFDVKEEEILQAIDIVIENGWIPIIAHPERFECIQINQSLPFMMIQKGALLQMNKGSLLSQHGRMAKETALYLLDHHYISFVGSDAHHPRLRDANMALCYDMVCDLYGRYYADDIFYHHARQMLKNQDIRKRGYNEEKI